jgi:hypothetical protein
MLPLILPKKISYKKFWHGKKYHLITSLVLLLISGVILYQHYDIALDITLGFLGLNR